MVTGFVFLWHLAEVLLLSFRCVTHLYVLFFMQHCAAGFTCSMFLCLKFNVSGFAALRSLETSQPYVSSLLLDALPLVRVFTNQFYPGLKSCPMSALFFMALGRGAAIKLPLCHSLVRLFRYSPGSIGIVISNCKRQKNASKT